MHQNEVRNMVLSWLEELPESEKTVLHFCPWRDTVFTIKDGTVNIANLTTIIWHVLQMAVFNNSITPELEYQCGAGRWRSSLDIWRHVRAFRPGVSLTDVMRCIYDMQGDLMGHYCSTVERYVFKEKPEPDEDEYDEDEPYVDTTFNSEHGISFDDWGYL